MKNILNRKLDKYVSKVLDWKTQLDTILNTKLHAKREQLEQKLKLYAANYVNDLLRQEIIKQGKDPDASPQPKAPEPTVADTFKQERPRFYNPYVPSWVRESFSDPSKHVVRNPLPKSSDLQVAAPLIELTETEAITVMNDNTEAVQKIFDRVFDADKTENSSSPAVTEIVEEKITEIGADAIQQIRAAISSIELQEKLEKDNSVEVTSGSREVPKSKKKSRAKSKSKSKRVVKSNKFSRALFRRQDD